jgi:LysR family glycine cleavage system transcriptional activator
VDAAILIGYPSRAGLQYDYLFDCDLTPVCSPGYLNQKGPLQTPGDLGKHTLLQVYPSARDWSVWLEANKVEGITPDAGLQLDSYDVSLNSAAEGIGIALGLQPYISRDLESGRLIELFPGLRVRNPNRWYLAYRNEKCDQPKLELFRNWLLTEIRADETLLVADDPTVPVAESSRKSIRGN